jgi:hypothetical protein
MEEYKKYWDTLKKIILVPMPGYAANLEALKYVGLKPSRKKSNF